MPVNHQTWLPQSDGLISVIMACYNAAPFVEEAARSVLQQSCPRVELIVVDDGSKDESPEIVGRLADEYPGRIHLYFQNRMGPYPARNAGLRHARGQFIAFLDADDWWDPQCLEKLMAGLHKSKADLAYCGWQNVGDRIAKSEPYVPPAYEEQDPVVSFLKSCPWPIHAALVRRDVLATVDGFSERRFSSMDYDLWLRILGHTRNLVRVPEVLAYYRWHGDGQVSAARWRQVLDAVQVRRDFVSAFPSMVSHLPQERLDELVDGQVLQEGYRAYWRRDLHNAQKLFRVAFRRGTWQTKDLRYLFAALLPRRVFGRLVDFADQARGQAQE